MMDVKFSRLCLALMIWLCSQQVLWAGEDVKQSVVKIYTVFNSYNYHQPWQKIGQLSNQGSGCIIGGNRILTNAHVISDQMFLQVRRGGKAKKYTATVEIVAHECDLAILKVADDTFFEGATPLKLGTLPKIRDKVVVYGFPAGGDKLSITEGVVSRVEHSKYTHSGAYLLTSQIDAPINSGNSGGPVIKDNEIVGVAFQELSSQNFENIGYMVPAPVIKHFLNDIGDGRYDGTPDLGISMQKMENPDLRRRYQMAKDDTGVLTIKTYPNSPAKGILLPNDVILAINGHDIANDGTIEFRKNERTFFGHLMQKKQINESIELKILRQGAPRRIHIKLTKAINFERLVPYQRYDIPPTYYIIGGMVFEPLTSNYLSEYSAPTELANYFLNVEPSDKQSEVIILVKVLADEMNVGYHAFRDTVVQRVNGRHIASMADLVAAFEQHKGPFHMVEGLHDYKIVLSTRKVAEQSDAILAKYHIRSDRSLNIAKQKEK